MKLLDYKDMLRTPDIPEPDGRNALCIRHLEKMGYNLIIVSSRVFFSLRIFCLHLPWIALDEPVLTNKADTPMNDSHSRDIMCKQRHE